MHEFCYAIYISLRKILTIGSSCRPRSKQTLVILLFIFFREVKLQIQSLLHTRDVNAGVFVSFKIILVLDKLIKVFVLVIILLLDDELVEIVVHLEEEHYDQSEQNYVEESQLQEDESG
jgi:hypothetical protein